MAVHPALVRKEPVQIPFSAFYALRLCALPRRLANQRGSRSLIARLIKCEIPLSSFAFVNSGSNPRRRLCVPHPRHPLLPLFLFHRRTSCFHLCPHPSVPHRAHPRIATPFLGRARCPWTYVADADTAERYRAERRADICLTLIGKCFDLLPAFSAPFLSRLAVGAR